MATSVDTTVYGEIEGTMTLSAAWNGTASTWSTVRIGLVKDNKVPGMVLSKVEAKHLRDWLTKLFADDDGSAPPLVGSAGLDYPLYYMVDCRNGEDPATWEYASALVQPVMRGDVGSGAFPVVGKQLYVKERTRYVLAVREPDGNPKSNPLRLGIVFVRDWKSGDAGGK